MDCCCCFDVVRFRGKSIEHISKPNPEFWTRTLTSGIKPEFMLEKMAMSTSFGPQIWLILALKEQINRDIMMWFVDGFLWVCAEP